MKKSTKIIPIIILLTIFALIFPLKEVKADVINDITTAAIKAVVYILVLIFKTVAKIVLWIVGWVVDFVTDPEKLNIKYASQVGWMIIREIANLVIIFSLLVIAFGFILDIEGFDAKKSFFYLIIIAFLVNYSFLFVGAIYDFGNILIKTIFNSLGIVSLSATFDNFTRISVSDIDQSWRSEVLLNELSKASQYNYGTSGNINIINVSLAAFKYFNENKPDDDTLVQIMVNAILNLVLLFVYTASLISIMVALAIIFVMRAGMFLFLIILSPLAFSLLILPWTRGQSQKWWSEVIRWTVFPFLTLFFVYLALLIGQEMNCLAESGKLCGGISIPEPKIISPFVAFQNIFFIVLMFLAFSFANSATSFAVNVGRKVGDLATYGLGYRVPRFLTRKGIGYLSGRALGKPIEKLQEKLKARFGSEHFITQTFGSLTKPITESYQKQQKNLQSKFETRIQQFAAAKDPKEKEKYFEDVISLLNDKKNKNNANFMSYVKDFLDKNEKIKKDFFAFQPKAYELKKEKINFRNHFRQFTTALEGEVDEKFWGVISPFLKKDDGTIIEDPAQWDEGRITNYLLKNKNIIYRNYNSLLNELKNQGLTTNKARAAIERIIKIALESLKPEDFISVRDPEIMHLIGRLANDQFKQTFKQQYPWAPLARYLI